MLKACHYGLNQSCVDLADLLDKALQKHEETYGNQSSCHARVNEVELQLTDENFKSVASSHNLNTLFHTPRHLDLLIKELLERTCFTSKSDPKQGEACFHLANYTVTPHPCSERQADWSQAINYLLKACDLQTAEACWALGQRTLTSPRQLREQCHQGNQQSCALINHDIFKKYEPLSQARLFLDRACQADFIESCIPLSLLYFHGQGGARDLAQVKRLTQKICLANQKTISEQACRWHQELSYTK